MTQTVDTVISENYGLHDQKVEVVSTQEDSQRVIAAIATAAGDLGVKLAEIGGDLAAISTTSNEQLELFSELRGRADRQCTL